MRPDRVRRAHSEALNVNVVNLGLLLLILRDLNRQVLAHEEIAIVHGDDNLDQPVCAVNAHGLENNAHLLPGLVGGVENLHVVQL